VQVICWFLQPADNKKRAPQLIAAPLGTKIENGSGYLAFLVAFLSAFLAFFAMRISFCRSTVYCSGKQSAPNAVLPTATRIRVPAASVKKISRYG